MPAASIGSGRERDISATPRLRVRSSTLTAVPTTRQMLEQTSARMHDEYEN